MAETTLKEFLTANQELTFHEARICARHLKNKIWQIYVRMSRSMNYELPEDLIYDIKGEFYFYDFELGFLVDCLEANNARNDFSGLIDDDGWLRLEIVDIDIIGENEIMCFFEDSASCKVRAEEFDVRIANEDDVAGKFVFLL